MKYISLASLMAVLMLTSCSKDDYNAQSATALDLFDEFVEHVDANYIYFEEKNIEWQAVAEKYRVGLDETSTEENLLVAMEEALAELRDGHNLIETPFRRSKVFDFKAGYDIHFSLDVIEQNYIDSAFVNESYFHIAYLDDKTVYVYVSDMANIGGLKKLIRRHIKESTTGLIIDVRNNGGGDSNYVPNWMGDFVTEKTYLGAYIEKSGPARFEETEPINYYATPSDDFLYEGNIAVLINRRSYSATSYLAAMFKGLDQVKIVGQVTGGGGGGNSTYELSNGWLVSLSVSDFIDKENQTIELGVQPDLEIINTKVDLEMGRDLMLEAAISSLR